MAFFIVGENYRYYILLRTNVSIIQLVEKSIFKQNLQLFTSFLLFFFCRNSYSARSKKRGGGIFKAIFHFSVLLFFTNYFVDDSTCPPIPDVPPTGFFSGLCKHLTVSQNFETNGCFLVPEIPDVGQLMLAAFIPSSKYDIKNWYFFFCFLFLLFRFFYRWMGEKYDGMRLCWHPDRKILYAVVRTPCFFNNIFIGILEEHYQ